MLVAQHLVKQYGELNAVNDISFDAGAASAITQVIILFAAALVVGHLAVRRFEYQ